MKLKHFALVLVIICLPACTWVKITEEGGKVTLIEELNAKDCIKHGTVKATVKHKMGVMLTRAEDTVKEELITLARNRAAELGGDSIVAKGPVNEGSMSFDIYKCRE